MPEHVNDSLSNLFRRRDLLKVGGLTIGASVWPGSDSATAATSVGANRRRAKSVLYLWMAGGVTHIDSFDPKPNAPLEVRGTLGEIATNVPGIRFCETLPRLSTMADQLAVIRSYSHDSNDHLISQVYTLSGRKVGPNQLFSEPNIGSIVSYLQGPQNNLPAYIAVPGITFPGPPPHKLFVGGWLGSQYVPYALGGMPEEPDFAVGQKLYDPPALANEDLTPKSLALPRDVPLARLDRRQSLRESFDSALRNLEKLDTVEAAEAQYQNAVRLLSKSDVRKAFEISNEPDSVREMYGRTKIGGRCLMACRLIEAGARFVMVDYGYDPDYGNIWDNHNAPVQNHPPIQEMCKRGYHLAGMDRAFAGLITDLRARGLLESTLVVFLTEFGRTPKINANGGRDHWGAAGSIFFTGAGVRTGQVIGATDRTASVPTTRAVTPADIAATLYQSLGIDHHDSVFDPQNRRPRSILDHGEPINALYT